MTTAALPALTFPASTFKKLQPLEFLRRHLERNIRTSGRSLLEARQVTLAHINLSTTTSGSVVRMGNTSVVCGISAELAEPTVECPDKGYLVPNVVLSPLSNPKHKSGPPSDSAQSLSARISQLLLSTSPELERDLCVERGKCVWTLYMDIEFLNYDGNALDAAWISLSSALSRMELPPIQYNMDINRGVIIDGVPRKLSFQGENVFICSFVGIDRGKYILADPDDEEESLATETVVVAIDLERRLRYLHKNGNDLKREDIKRCIELAGERAGYLSFIAEESSDKTVY